MKMNHLTHNVSRLLSLLLVVAALAGLLTVGALADGGLSISVENVTKSEDGSTVTADVVVNGSASIAAGEFTVTVPDGLTLTAIDGNAYNRTNANGIEGLNAVTNVDKKYFGFYIDIINYDAWNPNDAYHITKIATLTFTVSDNAVGNQTIGLTGVTLGSDGAGDAGGSVSISGVYEVSQSGASIDFGGATLTFNMNGHGDVIEPKTVAVGGTVTAPTDPTATGYTFGGWYTDAGCTSKFTFGALSADTTVYAKWTANKVNVTLNANGGTCDKDSVAVTYDGTYGKLPEPVMTGYTFKGWFDGDTKIEATTKVTKADAHTLTAKWEINKYTITLDANGGTLTGESTLTKEYNTAYGTLPVPTRDGFNFVGWFTAAEGGTQVNADTKAVENCTIYAQWTEMGVLPVDTAAQTFTYDGIAKSFEVKPNTTDVENFPSDGFTVTYSQNGVNVEEPTNAGIYDVTINHDEVKDGDDVVWTKYEKPIKGGLVIEKAKVKEPAADTNVFTYDGTKKTYTVVENALYTVSDNEQTNAGEYKVTITLKDAANYKWEAADDSEALEYDFVIAKAKVTAPTADSASFVYTGEEQTYTVTTSADYEVTGNKQKDAGTYTVTVSLKDTKNTAWTDGTTAAKEYTFTIAKATKAAPEGVTATAETIYKLADGKITGVDNTMEYSADNGVTWTAIKGSKLEDLKAGEYQVRYAESENYLASAAVKVIVGEGAKLTATFVTNGGTEVEPQTGLGYKDALDSSKTTTTRTGYTFDGWYKDEAFKNAWDFATARMDKDDITLYAKWSYSVAVSGNDSFTTGSEPEDGLTIEIGKGIDLSKDNLKEVKVDGKKLDETDYTISDENGLTVTLSKEFLATLKTGEHKVGIELDGVSDPDNAEGLSVSFTIKAKEAANGGTTGTGKKAPHTGDSSDLLLWSVVTLGAGAGLVCIGKKRREN